MPALALVIFAPGIQNCIDSNRQRMRSPARNLHQRCGAGLSAHISSYERLPYLAYAVIAKSNQRGSGSILDVSKSQTTVGAMTPAIDES